MQTDSAGPRLVMVQQGLALFRSDEYLSLTPGADLCRLPFSHKSHCSWVVKILRRGFMAVAFLFLSIYILLAYNVSGTQ